MLNLSSVLKLSCLKLVTISSYCNNVVITYIGSSCLLSHRTRAHIGSNCLLSHRTRAHIGSNCLLSRFTRVHIGWNCLLSRFTRGLTRSVLPSVDGTRIHIGSALLPIAPFVGKTQRLRGQSAGVVNKVDATAAR